jgi:hypothetical protein
MKIRLPKSFENIIVLTVHELYAVGLSMELPQYAKKKYSGHRMIPNNVKSLIGVEIASK